MNLSAPVPTQGGGGGTRCAVRFRFWALTPAAGTAGGGGGCVGGAGWRFGGYAVVRAPWTELCWMTVWTLNALTSPTCRRWRNRNGGVKTVA